MKTKKIFNFLLLLGLDVIILILFQIICRL